MPIPESDVITSCPGDKCDSSTKKIWCASKNSGNLYHCNPFTKLKDVDCIGDKDKTNISDETQSDCEQLCKQDSTCTVFSWKGSGDVGECRTRSGDPPEFKWGGCGETVWVKEDSWENVDPVTCDPDNAPNCDNTHQFCRTYDVPENIHKWWSCNDGKWSLEQYITDQIPAPDPSNPPPDPGCCSDVIKDCC